MGHNAQEEVYKGKNVPEVEQEVKQEVMWEAAQELVLEAGSSSQFAAPKKSQYGRRRKEAPNNSQNVCNSSCIVLYMRDSGSISAAIAKH